MLCIEFAVPSPDMLVVSRPSDAFSNGHLSVLCSVSLALEVDTPVRVSIRWNAPSHIYGNNRITEREESSQTLVKNSTLLINPVSFDDDGFYTCTATIESLRSTVIGVQWATQGLNIDIGT